MEEYTEAEDKPSRLLVNYITLRLGSLKCVHTAVADNEAPIEYDEIRNQFGVPGLDDKQISNTTDFLHQLDLIDTDESEAYKAINSDSVDGEALEPRLLYHLRKQGGKQNHYLDIHRVLISQTQTPIHLDEFVPEIRRATDYDFTWNKKKLRGWGELMDDVGLVRFTERNFYDVPSRALVFDIVEEAISETSGSASHVFGYIHENFFPCLKFSSNLPRVYNGMADAVKNIEDEGFLKLRRESDAQEVVELETNDEGQSHRVISRVKLANENKPSGYRYPIEELQS